MRLVLCWSYISGYMAACCRALSKMPGIELEVIAFQPWGDTFHSELVRGLHCRLLTPEEQNNSDLILSLVKERRPDVFYETGWFHPPYRRLVSDPSLASVPKLMGVDTPWRGIGRQYLARVVLRPFVRRIDRVIVAGERSWQYMRMLGVPETKLRRGLYGIDYASLAPVYEQRCQQSGGWPRRFLYIGRYEPEKGLCMLAEAYRRYRKSVKNPWPLGCCGSGSEQRLLEGQEGIENFGFKQPGELGEVMRQHGAFVLASHFDPWPLVVVEASAAGLPVICTEACGSAVELVRPYYNGVTAASGDVGALAAAMQWMHESVDLLPEMGRRGRELAAAYSAEAWAVRWSQALREFAVRGQ